MTPIPYIKSLIISSYISLVFDYEVIKQQRFKRAKRVLELVVGFAFRRYRCYRTI